MPARPHPIVLRLWLLPNVALVLRDGSERDGWIAIRWNFAFFVAFFFSAFKCPSETNGFFMLFCITFFSVSWLRLGVRFLITYPLIHTWVRVANNFFVSAFVCRSVFLFRCWIDVDSHGDCDCDCFVTCYFRFFIMLLLLHDWGESSSSSFIYRFFSVLVPLFLFTSAHSSASPEIINEASTFAFLFYLDHGSNSITHRPLGILRDE